METKQLESLIKKTLVFRGSADGALLATRGVYLVNDLLIEADTGNHRIILNELNF